MIKTEFRKCSPNSVFKVEPKQNQFWNPHFKRFKVRGVQSWEKKLIKICSQLFHFLSWKNIFFLWLKWRIDFAHTLFWTLWYRDFKTIFVLFLPSKLRMGCYFLIFIPPFCLFWKILELIQLWWIRRSLLILVWTWRQHRLCQLNLSEKVR